LGLSLHNHRPRQNLAAMRNVADPQVHEIAAAQLAFVPGFPTASSIEAMSVSNAHRLLTLSHLCDCQHLGPIQPFGTIAECWLS
jgi:hypothetical protein